jgi:pyruvate-formate lyase-activating enzyme
LPSPVPDLLFDDQRDARVEEIRPYLERPHELDETARVHRVTVFVSYRCNLSCPYCKTIVRDDAELEVLPQRASAHDLASFERLLGSFGDTMLVHVHFTGGEASLHPHIVDMMAAAKRRDGIRLSLTSNGTAPPERYMRLARAGLDELRISIDAADAVLGRALTALDGAWERSLATLRLLGHAKASDGLPLHLIANTVVAVDNRERLADIVRLLMSTGVDDIKLITEVDSKGFLGGFDGRASVVAELRSILAAQPPAAFPLLRRKLVSVFSTASIGLETIDSRPGFRCYIPLTERTVDAVHYYPCSVYLREGGAALGRIDEPQAEQRRKTADFVLRSDCMADPICSAYCLHCTREYNVAANAVRGR